MYDSPPNWWIALWAIALFCVALTCALSARMVALHRQAAKKAGFGFVMNDGPRCARIVQLLCMPPIFSISSAVQITLPSATNAMAFIRTVVFAWTAWRTMQLLYILGGGASYSSAVAPKEPVRAFAKPPCCCCVCKVTHFKPFICGQHPLRVMVFGVWQFMLIAPTIGLLDLLYKMIAPYDTSKQLPLTIILLISTLTCSWNYRSFIEFFDVVIKQNNPGLKGKQIAMFVQMQVIISKLLDMILDLALAKPYDNGHWKMPRGDYAGIISGWIMCVIELVLMVHACRALPVNMYPPQPNYETGIPLDFVAMMELSGIRPSDWNRLKEFNTLVSGRDHAHSDVMELDDTHPAASTLGKSDDMLELPLPVATLCQR